MFYLIRILFLLISIDQETVLNWFGIEDPNAFSELEEVSAEELKHSTEISLETLNLVINGLLQKVQDGLALTDIESILFFILFIRFIILAIRYNLKTSFFITCIGLVAAYLWYRHLIDLMASYKGLLLDIPFFNKLGVNALQLEFDAYNSAVTDLQLGENVHWYNPGKLIYYAFMKGIIYLDPETGLRHYIDPISMIVANLKESQQAKILPLYYTIYNIAIPKIYTSCTEYWSEMSGLVTYVVITRIGKRYCPYLIRWHWTSILILQLFENIPFYLIYRIWYYQENILEPNLEYLKGHTDYSVLFEYRALDFITIAIVLAHMSLVFFGMFHAIWGQYFYIPFIVENIELHVGPRPKNSIYSGGNTAWQDEKYKVQNRLVPKVWYGWFGRGTQKSWPITITFKKFVRKKFKKLKKRLKNLFRK